MSYMYLFIAIISEVIGTSFLKMSEGFSKLYPTLATALAFVICFYFLSLSIRIIPLNIAYATWSGIGLVIVSLISVVIFKESINTISIIGICLIIIGVVLLNFFGSN